MSARTESLQPAELKAVYAISRIVAETLDRDEALAAIVRLARPVFIFDNAVLYLETEQGGLEPAFARAIGRGRSTEADLAWGERAAYEAFRTGSDFLYQPEVDPNRDRLEQHFYLALPLRLGGKCIGSLVFIRFGGPAYKEEQINLAKFIATHVTQVLEHRRLVERIGNLEAERRLARLQSDFVATISHEFKTPLGFIKGYSTTLLRKDTEWDAQTRREFLTIIDEEADRLSELMDNLLDSSRLQTGTLDVSKQPVDLNALIDEAQARWQTRHPELQIHWQPGPGVHVLGDPKRLAQVLENLVGNAAKYAPQGPIWIALTQRAGWAQISVRDSGPGIKESEQALIFKRFYRSSSLKSGTRGSGLGLYICEQIVKAHSGEIRVKSGEGTGAEFQVRLPLDDARVARGNKERAL